MALLIQIMHCVVSMKPKDVTDTLDLTQEPMEKKEKAITARAASCEPANVAEVWAHWLARTQKQMNHRSVHAAVPQRKCQQIRVHTRVHFPFWCRVPLNSI